MKILTENKTLNTFMQTVIVPDAIRRSVTNEQDLMDIREANQRSECCNAPVMHEGLHTHCLYCGNFCNVI